MKLLFLTAVLFSNNLFASEGFGQVKTMEGNSVNVTNQEVAKAYSDLLNSNNVRAAKIFKHPNHSVTIVKPEYSYTGAFLPIDSSDDYYICGLFGFGGVQSFKGQKNLSAIPAVRIYGKYPDNQIKVIGDYHVQIKNPEDRSNVQVQIEDIDSWETVSSINCWL